MTARMTAPSQLPPGPDYGRCFAAWRAACAPDWLDYMYHPFVQGLGDGTQPRAGFLNYLVQDYRYLIHYTRAWALGVVKAATPAEMAGCSHVAHRLIAGEMDLHVGICAAAGIDRDALLAAPEAPESLAYTRYVLEAGYSGDFLDLLAALAPCALGYGEIGARLMRELAPDTPYADWIETYGSPAFQDDCRELGALIDAAVVRRLGDDPQAVPRWADLAAHFATATRLEVAFWGLGRA